mmetsp:Transcript_40332/g.111074  ORF Transcript_40332/g.111074 Transcript_40332/m.111074 type:complete len:418 (-) Transcript_40332:136-1389(-)
MKSISGTSSASARRVLLPLASPKFSNMTGPGSMVASPMGLCRAASPPCTPIRSPFVYADPTPTPSQTPQGNRFMMCLDAAGAMQTDNYDATSTTQDLKLQQGVCPQQLPCWMATPDRSPMAWCAASLPTFGRVGHECRRFEQRGSAALPELASKDPSAMVGPAPAPDDATGSLARAPPVETDSSDAFVPAVPSKDQLRQICMPYFDEMVDELHRTLQEQLVPRWTPQTEVSQQRGESHGQAHRMTLNISTPEVAASSLEGAGSSQPSLSMSLDSMDILASGGPSPPGHDEPTHGGASVLALSDLVEGSAMAMRSMCLGSVAGGLPTPSRLEGMRRGIGGKRGQRCGIDKTDAVCHHWKNKGWCRYHSACKFEHPEHKRGVGKKIHRKWHGYAETAWPPMAIPAFVIQPVPVDCRAHM